MDREFRDRHDIPGRDPESEFEDEGIPDLQEGSPAQDWSEDPQRAPIPRDEPTAVEDFGVTPDEHSTGEPLADRLDREVPDEQAAPAREDPTRPAGRLVAPDEGAHPDEEKDEEATEVGPDAGGYTAEEEAMRVRPE
ncbi:MAG TPA: DUF5709 domain-containing protein [Trebonia sp.]|jgi:hypothetical protein